MHDSCVVQGHDVPVRFDKLSEERARDAWQHGVCLADRSQWGRLRLTGADRLRFLHSQSTQDLANLQPGQGAPTVRCLLPSACNALQCEQWHWPSL